MIQRPQTLFLFIAFICSVMYFIFPIGTITFADMEENISVRIWGFTFHNLETQTADFMSGWYVMILAILSSFITFFSIFLYKRRTLQMRINIFNIFIKLGLFAMIFFFLYQGKTKIGIDFNTNLLIVLPIVEIILTILAIRLIFRDELLIKSLDRIR